jgi:acetyl-CoA decarbonylase/synthase complex subunit gamma
MTREELRARRVSRILTGDVDSGAGSVPGVPARLTWRDRLGSIRVRWGLGRDRYSIPPGLYALGNPGPSSEILVTANYKLSFDSLRAELPGRDFWILVLETNGINVWCAAGKGTFGTEELVARISGARIEEIVSHRRLILPQLGAPGVAAHEVRERSGFKVVYGPIRAADLPEFLDAGRRATPRMRRKTFPLVERTVLVPVELVAAFKAMFLLAIAFFFLSGLGGPDGYWGNALRSGTFAVTALGAALIAGAVLAPLLLPWLPGRAFSIKGLVAGFLVVLPIAIWGGYATGGLAARLELAAWLLLVPAISAFLAMNFTGASTYTSLSGVRKEMKIAVPLQIGASLVGLALWISARVVW